MIIPNFGGFIGQYEDSKFDDKTNLFIPPSKKASFNKHLKNDDGLLTHDVANTQNISYNKASETIKQFVLDLKSELQKNKRVEIEKVGTLYFDNNNLLKFTAATTNFSTKHFGLPTLKPLLKTKVISEEKVIAKVTPVIEKIETPIIPINTINKQSKSNFWWAAAVLIPIIFYSAWIPLKTDLISNSQQFHYSDLNPFTFQKIRTYKAQSITNTNFDDYNFEHEYSEKIIKRNLDDSTYLWVDYSIEVPVVAIETTFVDNKQAEVTEEIKLDSEYHLIGGCFGSQENAENLVSQLKNLGYDSKILDKNKGLFRVSVGKYSKRKAAKKAKVLLKSNQDISSWVLKK